MFIRLTIHHDEDRHGQHRLAADAIAEVTENRAAQRTSHEADRGTEA
jgi:hypothetical protein